MASSTERDPRQHDLFDRRRFLRLLGAGGAGVIAAGTTGSAIAAAQQAQPTSRGRRGPDDGVLVVSRRLVLRNDRSVGGVLVEPGGELIFDPRRDVTLRSTGNVVVEGRLTMRPDSARFLHRIVFEDVDESAFVGGGEDPVDSDVGLWVVGRGRLNTAGSPRTGWLRASSSLRSGDSQITLRSAPTGWQAGDEIVVVPTRAGDTDGFEVRRIRGRSGDTIRLSSPLDRDHPAVDGLAAEVANLTRNVRIEGTRGGRTHVFIRSASPQTIKYTAIRHVGPRDSGFVAGRYGLHFHHNHHDSHGSLVKGTVVRDSGSHSFVPHASHGITFRDTVAFDVSKDAYWWDHFNGFDTADNSLDIVYDHALAARVHGYGSEDIALSGFTLVWGNNRINRPTNTVRDSVAVGVSGGGSNSNGFSWPGSVAIWEFVDNTAHNNEELGIFVWDNSSQAFAHDIVRFRAYNNDRAGILHGAYRNSYNYEDIRLVGPSRAGIIMHANPGDQREALWRNVRIEGADAGIEYADHNLPAEGVAQLVDWTLVDVARPIVFNDANNEGGRFDIRNWTVNGGDPSCADVEIGSIHRDTVVRVFRGGERLFTVTADGCG